MNDGSYTYRWSYEAQAAYDREELKKTRKNGAAVFAVAMALAFLLCLGVLIAVLAVNRLPSADRAMSATAVAEEVSPATVLIYASNNTKYGFGTGFFVRSDGYILTNYHVISAASHISVTLYDGREMKATPVWISAADDLALLKIDGDHYPVPRIGNSDLVLPGDTAIAIGNPAGDTCAWSVTQGIISAVDRTVSVENGSTIVDMTLLQTDASLNGGNSGGPLCNDRGEVIGVVVLKLVDVSDEAEDERAEVYEGLNFAIPINGAMELVNAFFNGEAAGNSSISSVRPTMGIQAAAIEKDAAITDDYISPNDGILVVSVARGGASDGVLEPGDVILELGDRSVATMEELQTELYQYRAGDRVKVKVDRFGELLTLELCLGSAR